MGPLAGAAEPGRPEPSPDDDWWPPWTDPWTGYWMFSFTPFLNRFNPDTGKLWRVADVVAHLGIRAAAGGETRTSCEKVVVANPVQAEAYRSGKTNIIGFFIKLVMDETGKRASPQEAKSILEGLLKT